MSLISIIKNGTSFLQFPNLSEFSEISHGIFTRKNGYSNAPYKSLNTSYSSGDDIRNVTLNRLAIAKCFRGNELVFAKQVHGAKVMSFSKKNTSVASGSYDGSPECDAMITDIKKKSLVIQVADCQSIVMFDPVLKVVANVHSGWRGSIKNIIGQTISAMKKKFATNPNHIISGIGPSLGPCCAEFVNYRNEIPEKLWTYKNDSNYFDFWALSSKQLCDAGVLKENIYSSEICTRCNTDLFYSFREEGITGRFAAVIGLK
ncbi:MAG: peptidoglycan editing factor PgeF [Deltaproteobacteria bacterium]|nr:peptidoglycan editing factor PgeF [Deltaproteobacteria bacterium]